MRGTGACTLTSAPAPAGATRVMPCLVPVKGGVGEAPATFAEQKNETSVSQRGRNVAVGFHARHWLRKRV